MRTVSLAAALLLAIAGCGARHTEPPPEHLIGKYVFEDKGSIRKHPWDVKAALVLERDGQYSLDFQINIHDEKENEAGYGTYYVEGDRLVLDPADNVDQDDLTEFQIQGSRLIPKLGWGARMALKGLKVDPVFVKAE